MAIEKSICRSFWLELLAGTHVFGTDTLKLALYSSSASLGKDTTAYSTTNEASGTGYSAGGVAVAVASGFPKLNDSASYGIPASDMALVDFDDTTFSSVTISARAGLLYNSSKSNKAIAVLDFGQTLSPSGQDLVIQWPTADTRNCIIKIHEGG